MPLLVGARLGSYEIVAPIGAGGMGEVYRANDTQLGRAVAIKVLPDSVVHDAERIARFEREARALAALNHPNIAAIYGLERLQPSRAEDKDIVQVALVMELVEGPTLADRIVQGPIPLDEALPIARQIAEALEAAHEQDRSPRSEAGERQGARRRDAKVLDFGLAKALTPEGSARRRRSSRSMSPTITTPAMTQAGMILGTAAYMAPEQAQGRAVDRRAPTSGHLAPCSRDAHWGTCLPRRTSPTRSRLGNGQGPTGRRCPRRRLRPSADCSPALLEEDQRLRDIGEARIALEDIIAGVAPEVTRSDGTAARGRSTQRRPGYRARWQRAVLTMGIALGAWWMPWRPATTVPDLVRLEIRRPRSPFSTMR